ncbi:MAG: hypothetical protein J6T10_16080 [Methanobrevibacter sp.]|nr:hypothetical protein [Methanobrevibacter sp.]
MVVKQLGIKDPLEIKALIEIAKGSSKPISFFNSMKMVYSLGDKKQSQEPQQQASKEAVLEPYDNSELSAISKSALSELTKDD